MDPRTDLIVSRLDRLEDKIDILLSEHWKRIGVSVFISVVFSVTSTVLLILYTK